MFTFEAKGKEEEEFKARDYDAFLAFKLHEARLFSPIVHRVGAQHKAEIATGAKVDDTTYFRRLAYEALLAYEQKHAELIKLEMSE